MTLQEVWSLLNLYNSSFSGEQIDEAIGVILNGGISAAVDAAQASAEAAAKSASEAAGSEANAGAAATNAQSAASRASGSATEAESYAHGGTGTREGEDEDNARYYSEEAAKSAAAAAASEASVAADSAVAASAAAAAEAAAQNAGNSAAAAADSAAAAEAAADSIAGSVGAAAGSATAAKQSETNAKDSETAAKDAQEAAEAAKDAAEDAAQTLNSAQINAAGHLILTAPDGSTRDLGDVTGEDGNSIESITRTAGNGAPGTTDTYTVTLTDGSKTQFQVYNGKDGTGSGDMTAAVYDPQGKAQDVFAYADTKLAKAGGDMTGAINFTSGKSISTYYGGIKTWHDIAHQRLDTTGRVGTICINVGSENTMLDMDVVVASYSNLVNISLAGYTYTSGRGWFSPAAIGFGTSALTKIRSATAPDGSRCFLIGETTTNWEGYLFVSIPRFSIRFAAFNYDFASNIKISILTDETGYTSITNLANNIGVSRSRTINGKALSEDITLAAADVGAIPNTEPVPIALGGTGAASAADALSALGAPSVNEMTAAISEATADLVTTETMNTAIANATADAVTRDEMNTAIATAITGAIEGGY